MKRTIAILITATMFLFVLAGCGKKAEEETVTKSITAVATKAPAPSEKTQATTKATKTPTPTPKATKTPTPTPTPTPTSVPLGNINPFTGLPIEKDISNMRPYVFMCNNISVATPHVGVSQSDMIMEMMEEGGITRMMAFFADPSDVQRIGSIRSARAYNIDTAMGYDAFLCHCGCSPEGDEMVAAYGMQNLDQISGQFGEDSYYRDPTWAAERGGEHSLIAVGPGLVNMAQALGYRLEHEEGYDYSYGLSFSDDAVDQCTGDATSINVVYAGGKTSSFTYFPEDNYYLMYQYGEEYTDNYEAQVPFANVIMIYAATYLQDDGLHLTIDLSSGDGYFFTGGKYVPILWYKEGTYDVFHFTLEDGTPLELSKGRTFVAVNQAGSTYQGGIEIG